MSPQLVIARRPDDLGEPLPQLRQRHLDVREYLADIAGHNQPVAVGAGP
jgi:hypothetical protein